MNDNEQGALIVEATFVFPIMFFVLFFLIYFGNMFYMRSQVDAIVGEAAVEAAACCADPLLPTISETNLIPDEMNNIQPYHSILGNDTLAGKVREKMKRKLDALSSGFFTGMNLRNTDINTFHYNKDIFASTFTVDVTYRIQFPIRFFNNTEPTILKIKSRSTVPVTDTPEFIMNVDMAMDFLDASGVTEKLNEQMNKISSQVSRFLGR